MPKFDIQQQFGRRVFEIIGGKYPGHHRIVEYEVMRAPNSEDPNSPDSVWFIGKRCNDAPGVRPKYIDIPWKSLAYMTDVGGLHNSPADAINMLERRYKDMIDKMRVDHEC